MSLIYDALRALPADSPPAPLYGSVCATRMPSVRRSHWAWGAGLVVMAAVAALALASHDWRIVPAAPAEAAAPAAVAAARITAPAAPAAVALAAPAVRAQARIVEPVSMTPAAAPQSSAPPARLASAAPSSPPTPQPAPAVVTPAVVTPAVEKPAADAASVRTASRPSSTQTGAQAHTPPMATAATAATAPTAATGDFGNSLRRFNSLVARAEFEPAARLLDELRMQGLSQLTLSRMTAYLALQANRLEQARRSYEQVLAQFPYDREAVLNLALIDLREGFLTEAEQRLRTFTELKPDDAQVRALLAQVRAQGRR